VRLLIIQFGNYAEAVHRFADGGGETYYGQRYTVEYVANLVRAGNAVRLIAIGEDAPLERLPSGVESVALRVFGARFRRPRIQELIRMAEEWKPTHLILNVPLAGILRWGRRRGVQTLPLFADSFHAGGLRRRFWYRQLAAALNDSAIRWVANHGPNAAADLVRIGVVPDKVLPFDWPSLASPCSLPPKRVPANPNKVRLTYVGQVTTSKGVGDLIDAVAIAKSNGRCYAATIVGKGDINNFRSEANRLGVEDRIEFTGGVSHERVLKIMSEGDAVVIPSRHEYPEGMPMTIYEGLASRAPVVVSDHPMFRNRIIHMKNGVVFPASNPQSLYETIHALIENSVLYERLSSNADEFCNNFLGPLKWDQLITRWISATSDDDNWLRQFALSR
jgi:glycosyltransferase involved in cell wall biosynthesis